MALYIEGQYKGTTPMELTGLTPGQKNLEVRHDGYTKEKKRVHIRAGGKSTVSFVLSRISRTGWLTIRPEPADAQVRILNIGPKYSRGMELDAGRYHVEVSAGGYETQSRWVDLVAGQYLDLDIALERQAAAQASRGFTDPTTGMEFVYVPGGCFRMGDTFGVAYDDEEPVHEVCVDDFYMDKYEVTQGEYQKITGSNRSRFKKGERYTVEQVRWNDAQGFIRKLNSRSGKTYRLPTEAEWEYAAREGGKKVRFGTGKDTIGPDEANFNASAKYKRSYSRSGTYRKTTMTVGIFPPNNLGIHGMSGHVSVMPCWPPQGRKKASEEMGS